MNKLIFKLKPHNSHGDLNPLFLIEITLLASGFAEVQDCMYTGFLVVARGVWFPGQGLNLGALHFEHRVSCGTTRGVPRSYALL